MEAKRDAGKTHPAPLTTLTCNCMPADTSLAFTLKNASELSGSTCGAANKQPLAAGARQGKAKRKTHLAWNAIAEHQVRRAERARRATKAAVT